LILDETASSQEAHDAINARKIHDDVLGDFTVHMGFHTISREARRKPLYEVLSLSEYIKKDAALIKLIVEKLEEPMGDTYKGLEKIKARAELVCSPKAALREPTSEDGNEPKPNHEGENDEGAIVEDQDDEKSSLDLVSHLYLEYMHS